MQWWVKGVLPSGNRRPRVAAQVWRPTLDTQGQGTYMSVASRLWLHQFIPGSPTSAGLIPLPMSSYPFHSLYFTVTGGAQPYFMGPTPNLTTPDASS